MADILKLLEGLMPTPDPEKGKKLQKKLGVDNNTPVLGGTLAPAPTGLMDAFLQLLAPFSGGENGVMEAMIPNKKNLPVFLAKMAQNFARAAADHGLPATRQSAQKLPALVNEAYTATRYPKHYETSQGVVYAPPRGNAVGEATAGQIKVSPAATELPGMSAKAQNIFTHELQHTTDARRAAEGKAKAITPEGKVNSAAPILPEDFGDTAGSYDAYRAQPVEQKAFRAGDIGEADFRKFLTLMRESNLAPKSSGDPRLSIIDKVLRDAEVRGQLPNLPLDENRPYNPQGFVPHPPGGESGGPALGRMIPTKDNIGDFFNKLVMNNIPGVLRETKAGVNKKWLRDTGIEDMSTMLAYMATRYPKRFHNFIGQTGAETMPQKGEMGAYNSDTGRISINWNLPIKDMVNTFAHETTHAWDHERSMKGKAAYHEAQLDFFTPEMFNKLSAQEQQNLRRDNQIYTPADFPELTDPNYRKIVPDDLRAKENGGNYITPHADPYLYQAQPVEQRAFRAGSTAEEGFQNFLSILGETLGRPNMTALDLNKQLTNSSLDLLEGKYKPLGVK